MQVYIVTGGCVDDYHIIAVYRSLKKAEKRVEKENKECNGLHAHIEMYAFSDIEDARKIKDWLNEIGFKGVEIFKVPYIPDEITWGYVEDNKVE